MTNREIAAALDEVADLLEFQGANPFRVRAYRGAARRSKDYPLSLAEVHAERGAAGLRELEGVGADLAEKIAELTTTGRLGFLEGLRGEVPAGVLNLLRVPGLGPKKAAALHRELAIDSLDRLRAACEAGEVRKLKGFGAKTEEAILHGIDLADTAGQRVGWDEADGLVRRIVAGLSAEPAARRVEPAGSYRRGRETVGDLDLVVDVGPARGGDGAEGLDAGAATRVMDRFASLDGVVEVIARGETKMSARVALEGARGSLQVDIRCVPTESFGAALQYFTGSKDHNVEVRGRAKARALRVNEWGVYRLDTGERVAGEAEQGVYAALGLPCFPPELREARREFAQADAGALPRLLELADLRGDLHMHTSASDGSATMAEMAEAARRAGLSYIAITDHSKRVSMAHGLDADRLRAQWREVERLNEVLATDGGAPLRVLRGIECDILEAGGMDLPDDVLAEGDWVIASLHYGQQQPRASIMKRLLGAIENPWVSVVAHPTGRLIGRRAPYDLDIDELIAAAAENGKLLELNANPMRLDLDDVHAAAARARGVPIVVNSDAHSPAGFDVLRHGVRQARRAGLAPEDVANTWPLDRLLAAARRRG